jgi:hypothetical protein
MVKSRRMKWAGRVTRVGEQRNSVQSYWWEKLKRSPGRTWRRWRDNITVYYKEIGYKFVDWIHLAQDRDQC